MARRRAKDEEGHFIADNPATPDVNEAWVVTEEKSVVEKEPEPVAEIPQMAPKSARLSPEVTMEDKMKEIAEEANLEPTPGQLIGLRLLARAELRG
jgi:hypothetical protein